MDFKQTRVRLFQSGSNSTQGFRTAVSLHCHTHHSKESITFVPHYMARVPIAYGHFQKLLNRYHKKWGEPLDFSKGYWTPPLAADTVYESETKQIEREVGLQALVSLTDHDDIEGSALVSRKLSKDVPISVEWTVPFDAGFFHLGLHNLPRAESRSIMDALAEYTSHPVAERLAELFVMLHDLPDVLIVFNHPLWDIEHVGAERHALLLKAFLDQYGEWIDCLEVNGYRAWRENKGVLQMAEELGYPVVSGGDRHACDPNAVLNLTRAETLAEFIHEVRHDRRSEILLMPAYQEPLAARQLRDVADVLRYYPDYPVDQRRWMDRVYFEMKGSAHSLPYYWPVHSASVFAKRTLGVLRLLGSRRLQPVLRLLLSRNRVSPEELIEVPPALIPTSRTQLDS
jgi:hypothetical protein